jgi:hypothetical protein
MGTNVAGDSPSAEEENMTSGIPTGPAGIPTPPSAATPEPPPRAMVTVATYTDYPSAQRAVDYLSDQKFPVEKTAIVGSNLSIVENVLGRLTTARAAMAGAASGAWFGLFIGLLFGLFTSGHNWFYVVIASIVIGAVWFAIFGAIAHAATGGRRDFASRTTLKAGQYAVNVETDVAEQARQLLVRLNWNTANPS